MPRPPAERTPDGETVVEGRAVLDAELPAAGHGRLADPHANRAREALGRSDDRRVMAAVARQSGMAQQTAG
jgi:hypothetical protein